ncbi:MAG: hypothetical protein FJY37_06880, partial [Betaproteobacteria bacterium]|nr:hypothetical protein [Betaproteobacteria bacterium]
MKTSATTSHADSRPGLTWVSDAVRQKLARLAIHSEQDLALHLPLRYEDETRLTALADAPADQIV